MTNMVFKWSGRLNARKIVERMIANVATGVMMGAGFYAISWVLG